MKLQRVLDTRLAAENVRAPDWVAVPESTWFRAAAGYVVLIAVGAGVLWVTWPVWLAPLISVLALEGTRRANRSTASKRLRRIGDAAELTFLILTIVTGVIFVLHLAIIVYDWLIS